MAVDDLDLKPKRFTTDDFPERERLPRWREEFGRTLVRCDFVPSASDEPFWAEAVLHKLPGLHVASCAGSPMLMDRPSSMIAADAHAGDSVGLIVNTGLAPLPVWQRGSEVMVAEGGAVLVRHDEACLITSTTRHVGFVFPRTALAVRTENLDGAVMKQIVRDDPALRLLLNYVRLIQSDPELSRPALQQSIVSHIHDLAALVLGADRDNRAQAQRSVGAARLKQAIAYIGKHFSDPDLTVASVAKGQDISSRYLQDLLEQSGASFTARVNELRLTRALALLTRFPDRPISAIAAQVGFSNVSHFNRLFRVRFGDSPTGVRRGS
jgi:AraC-like DNA-binding protein